MTYFEKLRRALKVNSELLSESEVKRVNFILDTRTVGAFGCPGHVFLGAPKSGETNCPKCLCCMSCWEQEIK